MFAALAAGRHGGGKPHLVAGPGAVHRLQHQFEVELHLQFADHQDWRLALAQADYIAIADFAFDDEIQALQEFLYRRIERYFGHAQGITDSTRSGMPASIALPSKRRSPLGRCRHAALGESKMSTIETSLPFLNSQRFAIQHSTVFLVFLFL